MENEYKLNYWLIKIAEHIVYRCTYLNGIIHPGTRCSDIYNSDPIFAMAPDRIKKFMTRSGLKINSTIDNKYFGFYDRVKISINISIRLRHYKKDYISTTVHELRHAYDDYIHGLGKTYENLDPVKYFNQALEIRAFFSGAMVYSMKYIKYEWSFFYKSFKQSYIPFPYLTRRKRNDTKKLVRKVYHDYHRLNQDLPG